MESTMNKFNAIDTKKASIELLQNSTSFARKHTNVSQTFPHQIMNRFGSLN